MNIEEIRKYLPHRYPFLLVDRVIEIELDKYIKAYKKILPTMNHTLLAIFLKKALFQGY